MAEIKSTLCLGIDPISETVHTQSFFNPKTKIENCAILVNFKIDTLLKHIKQTALSIMPSSRSLVTVYKDLDLTQLPYKLHPEIAENIKFSSLTCLKMTVN